MEIWDPEAATPPVDLQLMGSPSKALRERVNECEREPPTQPALHMEAIRELKLVKALRGKSVGFLEGRGDSANSEAQTDSGEIGGGGFPGPSQNKLTLGLAILSDLCFEGLHRLEDAPGILIKLRDVLMETIYYCIEVNKEVYEEFVYSLMQKSSLYMEKLIHKALRLCQADSRSTTCYHVIKCAHDVTLLTFTFTNPYKVPRMLQSPGTFGAGELFVANAFDLVLLLDTNRSLIVSMSEISQRFVNPETRVPINDTPRDLFRFELKEILNLLKRTTLILLNNCVPEEAVVSYFLGFVNRNKYVLHDLESLEEYLSHFSRLQAYVKQTEPERNALLLMDKSRRKKSFRRRQRGEDANNRSSAMGPLVQKRDAHENARIRLYQKLREKGIEIHPNGTHNINVTTDFLRQVDEKKKETAEDTTGSQNSDFEEVAKENTGKVRFMLYQKKQMQKMFQNFICNFPKLKWCTLLQSINYLQIFVDLYNEIYQEELVIEQNYNEAGDLENTVIRRIDDAFSVKRGHYNFRGHTWKEVKIPEFVNFFDAKPKDDDAFATFDRLITQRSHASQETRIAPNEVPIAAGTPVSTENGAQNELPELTLRLLNHEASLRKSQRQREYESRYNETYEMLCESVHINKTERWGAYFAQLKARFDSESVHITNCNIDRGEILGSGTKDESAQEVQTHTSDSESFVNFGQGSRIPLSLKVFQLNEAVAYEVRNIRADYEDAHVVNKVEFREQKCYKCKFVPWHKHTEN